MSLCGSYVRPDVYPQDDDDGTGHELNPGDVVIVAFDSDNPDSLAFVPTVDVPEGTIIKFTDNGWDSTGFREGEGIIRSVRWRQPLITLAPPSMLTALRVEQVPRDGWRVGTGHRCDVVWALHRGVGRCAGKLGTVGLRGPDHRLFG